MARALVRLLLLVVGTLVLAGCGDGWGGGTWYFAVGWRNYELPGCRRASVASGTSLRHTGSGFTAVEPGTTKLRCEKDRARIVVKRADRLVIEGPATLVTGNAAQYRVQAFAGNRSVDVGKESDVAWTARGAADVQPAYCNHPIFSCPGNNSARINAGDPGAMTIEVRFEGLLGTLEVTVTAR